MSSANPYLITHQFEELMAEFTGSKYAVAIESCTMALFLCLQYQKVFHGTKKLGTVTIPNRTYVGVPCSIINAGGKVKFKDIEWEGEYQLKPFKIWDAALRLKPNMYHGGMQCLSFHVKKALPIGRGGMILLNDKDAYEWLKKARFDGRNPIPMNEDYFDMIGWNAYMEPANAARGIQLLQVYKNKREFPDLVVKEQGYPNLSKFPIYQR